MHIGVTILMTTDAKPRFSISATAGLPIGKATAMALLLGCLLVQSAAAEWSIATGNDLLLDTSGVGFSVGEMSGVTYLGPSPAVGKHRFLTVQDNGNGLITFDAAFDLSGNLVAAEAVGGRSLSTSRDFEGIAQVGSSIFLSEENGPGVREYDPETGNELQNVVIPSLFTDFNRNNLGLESLAYDRQGSKLWTAMESALTVDGGVATAAAGATVRLLELDIDGANVTAGRQFAYEVEKVHNSGISPESGLVELVVMPDGALLALERSFVVASFVPSFLNRIYELDVSGADDVSQIPFDTGLTGQAFTPIDKGDPSNPVWMGAVGGGFGQNLEGLTVGPRLPNGDWILLGVVDDGDPVSNNTIISLLATPTPAIPADANTGDFNQDNVVDGADFLAWQRGFAVATLAGLNDGDGNHDGTVTAADLAIWESQYGTAAQLATLQAVPEPTSAALMLLAGISSLAIGRRS